MLLLRKQLRLRKLRKRTAITNCFFQTEYFGPSLLKAGAVVVLPDKNKTVKFKDVAS